MTRMIILITAISILSSAGLPANQEEVSVRHILRWFPDGTYHGFSHINLIEARRAGFYQQFLEYQKTVGGIYEELFDEIPLLPESLKQRIEAISTASLQISSEDPTLAEAESFEEKWEKIEKQEGISEAEKKKLLEELTRKRSGIALTIINIDDPVSFIEKAESADIMTKTGKRLYKKPIYTADSLQKGKTDKLFLWETGQGELLVARSIKAVRAMAKAGMGQATSMVDNQEYVDSFEFLRETGQIWTVDSFRALQLKKVESTNENSGDDSESLPSMEDIEEGLISVVQSWEIEDDHFISRSINVFGSEEKAKEMHQNIISIHKKHGVTAGHDKNDDSERYEVHENLFQHSKYYRAKDIKHIVEAVKEKRTKNEDPDEKSVKKK